MSPVLEGILMAITIRNLFGITFGYVIGILVGSIPGFSATMALALLLPLTYALDPVFAVASLVGCYTGGVYGGSISAILLNAPGAPGSAATAFDGYPLVQQGKAGKALGIALVASLFGGAFSSIALMVFARPVASIAVRFGAAEFTTLIFLSLTVIASTIGNTMSSIMKGLIVALLGLLVAMIGLDPITTMPRYTFGILNLQGGLSLIPVLIGLLAFGEILFQILNGIYRQEEKEEIVENPLDSWFTLADFKECFGTILRSSIIGTILGALPGIGATTAAFVAYDQAKKTSKNSKNFGKGAIEGIAAPEASNNAVCAASLIPLITLGIPGSVAAAVLGGAFLIHGLIPGPMLMFEAPNILYAMFTLIVLTDFIGFFVAKPFINIARRVIKVSKFILYPVVLFFCVIGAYGIGLHIFDVKVMFAMALVGLVMKKLQLSAPAFFLAFILGPFAEQNFRRAMIVSGNDMTIFVRRPLSLFFVILALFSLFWSIRNVIVNREKEDIETHPTASP